VSLEGVGERQRLVVPEAPLPELEEAQGRQEEGEREHPEDAAAGLRYSPRPLRPIISAAAHAARVE
jgi:hypothetical protein